MQGFSKLLTFHIQWPGIRLNAKATTRGTRSIYVVYCKRWIILPKLNIHTHKKDWMVCKKEKDTIQKKKDKIWWKTMKNSSLRIFFFSPEEWLHKLCGMCWKYTRRQMRGKRGGVLWWSVQLHAAEGAEEGRSKTHHGVLMAKHPAPKR